VRQLFRRIRPILYWGLPPAILYLIFTRLDLGRLAESAASADRLLVSAGIILVFVKIAAGALRWYQLAQSYGCTRLNFAHSFSQYWFSLALGMFTPGSLGSDAYRVVIGGRQTGRYLRGAFVIGIEKFAALFSCVALIACLYPFLTFGQVPDALSYAIDAAYAFTLLGSGVAVMMALMHRSRWLNDLMETFGRSVARLARTAEKVDPDRAARDDPQYRPPLELLRSVVSWRIAVPAIALSLVIHFLGAIQGQLFVNALGYELPFLVNLFIAPLSVLVLTLPITVGGLGVREGAYILFYGAFGVPVETALLISFFGLVSVLVGHSIGALLFYLRQDVQPA